MTPLEINAAARDIYNASGDTFFSDTQIYNWIQQASHILAKKAWLIESLTTTATVASTQTIAYPTRTIAIKRITVDGKKIKRITHREDDAITLSNSALTSTGYPIYYTDFSSTIYLRPIPDAVYTVKIYGYGDAATVTAASTLEIPELFHFDLVDYLLMRMFGKDKDVQSMHFYGAEWSGHVKDAISYTNKKKRTDSFATVQSEDTLPVNLLGEA